MTLFQSQVKNKLFSSHQEMLILLCNVTLRTLEMLKGSCREVVPENLVLIQVVLVLVMASFLFLFFLFFLK